MEEEITNKPKQSFTDYIKNNKITNNLSYLLHKKWITSYFYIR